MAKQMTKTTSTKTAVKNTASVNQEVKNNDTQSVSVEQEQQSVEVKPVEQTKIVRKYGEEDLILCRSITLGELILIGRKSENRYTFSNIDDTCEIEVRDLNSLRSSRSNYLYRPYMVIEDEEFLEQPNWKDVKNMYEETASRDLDEIIELPLDSFVQALSGLREGYKRALAMKVNDLIVEDEFDSKKKVQAIDEICGTDLLSVFMG